MNVRIEISPSKVERKYGEDWVAITTLRSRIKIELAVEDVAELNQRGMYSMMTIIEPIMYAVLCYDYISLMEEA